MRARRLSGRGSAARVAPRRDAAAVARSLQVGQTVKARVVRRLDEENYVINCKGADLCAQSETQLSRGQRLTGSVRQVEPKIVLRIAPERDRRPAPGFGGEIDVFV